MLRLYALRRRRGVQYRHCPGRQGIAVALFSGLSDDFMGDMLRHTLEASGVDYSPSTRAPLPTTLAFVRLEGGQARYTFTMRIAPAEC